MVSKKYSVITKGLFLLISLLLTPSVLAVNCDYYITSLPYDITDAGKTYCLNQSLTTTSYGIKYVNNTFNETYLYCFGNKIIGSGSNIGIIYGNLLGTGKYLKSYDCEIEGFYNGVVTVTSNTLWIENFTIRNVTNGVWIQDYTGDYARILNSFINSSSYGIYMDGIGGATNDHLIDGNKIYSDIGIYAVKDCSNTYRNNIIVARIGFKSSNTYGTSTFYNNLFNVSEKYTDIVSDFLIKFNTTKTLGTNIVGGPYIGGNYWGFWNRSGYSDTCTDSDSDGICDSPLLLATVNTTELYDYLPLAIYVPPTPMTLREVSPLIYYLVVVGTGLMFVEWIYGMIEELRPGLKGIIEALIALVGILAIASLIQVLV